MTNVLITGIGGGRSLFLLKALRMAGKFTCIGSDANYFNAGSYLCDKAYIVPMVNDPAAYLRELDKVIKTEKIEIVFATTQQEVAFMAAHKGQLESTYKIPFVVPEGRIARICLDKYRTQRFFETRGFTYIPTIYAANRGEMRDFAKAQGFPLIRKPVAGIGSRGVSIISRETELNEVPEDKSYVLQNYIENDDNEKFYNFELNEYTAEVFVNADDSVAGGIILKRALHNGETQAGYLVKDDRILDYLSTVAQATGIKGPINFQFRINKGKVYVFEINPLYSGTTAMRARMGFNSVALAIDSFVHGQHRTISQSDLQSSYFVRYLEETCIAPKKLTDLRDDGFIGNAS